MSERPQATSDLAPNGWAWGVLRGFREGRQDALREVYRMHVEDVARHLRHGFSFSSRGRDHRFSGYASAFELHDVLHETFLRAFEPGARDRYDGIRPYGPYLKAIARNIVLRGFRAREVLFPAIGDDVGEAAAGHAHVESNSGSPEQLVAREEVRALVQTFLQSLEPEERTLLRLRFVDGMSQRDAAEAMGLGRQQIRGREEKLRKRLVRYLARHGETALLPRGAIVPTWLVWVLLAEAWR